MFHPIVSPHDPLTALVACDMSGSYISHDGGKSWRMFNLRGPVRFFLFDPLVSQVIYAQTDNLWRSRDNGLTWKIVSPMAETIESISMASDHSDETINSDTSTARSISALVIDPRDSMHMYASAGGSDPTLFESTDAGSHWKKISSLPELASRLWMSRTTPAILVAAGAHFIVRKREGADAERSRPLVSVSASAGLTSDGALTIYSSTSTEIMVSHDSGATWKKSVFPGGAALFRAIATSRFHPQIAYVSYSGLQLDRTTWHGVARTLDSGRTWDLVWKESEVAAPNIQDAWITKRFGTGWGENPLDLAVADQDSSLVYATDFGRTLISRDAGSHWHAAYSHRSEAGTWSSTGLDVTTAYGIHFDPFNLDREFITYADISMFRSEDSGRSWASSSSGVPKNWLNTAYWMVFDPKVKGRAWSVTSNTHDLPRPKMFRHVSPDTYQGGICRSDDGGRTWTVSSNGMPATAPTDIVLDPESPPNSRTLYVAAFGRGVYKSTDDGRSWTAKNKGIQQTLPMAWRIILSPDHSLYLIVARRSENGSFGNNGDGGLYRSFDGAETWQAVPLPAGANGPTGLVVDPFHTERLFLSTWARSTGIHGEGGGVFASDDSGKHWRVALSSDQHIFDITADGRLAGTLYASGFESSAWVSRDAGTHWDRISGFNFKWGQRVVLDPKDSKSVYITTFGGGVWHGKVTVAPAILDIATPEMAPHS